MEVFRSMDAHFLSRNGLSRRFALLGFALLLLVFSTGAGQGTNSGARYETDNFIIYNAPTSELARQFGETAERCRRELAILWLGGAMPDWSEKCPIKVRVGNVGAGGATTFVFDRGEVFGWKMDIQGTAERIIDSVLPHEITHMVLASHFRRPVPRWLDEGAATSVEHLSERENYRHMLLGFLQRNEDRGLSFNRMVALKDYPDDIIPFYAQGFSVVEYLIALRGHRELVHFAETGMKTGNWNTAVRQHYGRDIFGDSGFERLGDLQESWLQWVAAGFPALQPSPEPAPNRERESNPIILASATVAAPAPAPPPVTLAAATPNPVYGNPTSGAVIRTTVTPIPATLENDKSRVVPIPSTFDISDDSILPAREISSDGWVGIDKAAGTPPIMVDAAKIPFYR